MRPEDINLNCWGHLCSKKKSNFKIIFKQIDQAKQSKNYEEILREKYVNLWQKYLIVKTLTLI
jgi:hypothetical protein